MALDKLVDSTQLNADLTSVANAIRAKSGSSSQLAFPTGFVSEIQAIPSGGSSYPALDILVPSGYTQLEYIQNDGIAWINTWLPWTDDGKLEVEMEFTPSQTTYHHVFGSSSFFLQNSQRGEVSAIAFSAAKINDSNYSATALTTTLRQIMTVTKSAIKVNPITVDFEQTILSKSSPTVSENANPIGIFTRMQNGAANYTIAGMKLYHWKLFRGNVLVQELIPAIRDSDEIIGLYDTVSGSFLTNAASSGGFVGGAR